LANEPLLYKRPPTAVSRLNQVAELRGLAEFLAINTSLLEGFCRHYRQADGKQYGRCSASYAAACFSRTANSLLQRTMLTSTHIKPSGLSRVTVDPVTVGADADAVQESKAQHLPVCARLNTGAGHRACVLELINHAAGTPKYV
jgi:hypothetical protein